MRSKYHAHVAQHVRGSSNPRKAFKEAAASWSGGVESNPSSSNGVLKLALIGVIAYFGAQMLGQMKATNQALGVSDASQGGY